MAKITITRALAEIKMIQKRINDKVSSTSFLNYEVDGKPFKKDFTPVESYDAVQSLINRQITLKAAIAEKNLTTDVEIAGKTMSITAALAVKSSLDYNKTLLASLKEDKRSIRKLIEENNENISYRCDELLKASLGKESKATQSEMDAITKPFLERNIATELDPLKIDEKIASLKDYIDDVEENLDFVLSEINATTFIDVD